MVKDPLLKVVIKTPSYLSLYNGSCARMIKGTRWYRSRHDLSGRPTLKKVNNAKSKLED